jgi:hypothetical protein
MWKVTIVLTLIISLAACKGMQQAKVNEKLNSYIGNRFQISL